MNTSGHEVIDVEYDDDSLSSALESPENMVLIVDEPIWAPISEVSTSRQPFEQNWFGQVWLLLAHSWTWFCQRISLDSQWIW